MSSLDLLKIEFMKVKRSKIVPLIFIAHLLVVEMCISDRSECVLNDLYIYASFTHSCCKCMSKRVAAKMRK